MAVYWLSILNIITWNHGSITTFSLQEAQNLAYHRFFPIHDYMASFLVKQTLVILYKFFHYNYCFILLQESESGCFFVKLRKRSEAL